MGYSLPTKRDIKIHCSSSLPHMNSHNSKVPSDEVFLENASYRLSQYASPIRDRDINHCRTLEGASVTGTMLYAVVNENALFSASMIRVYKVWPSLASLGLAGLMKPAVHSLIP